MILQKTQRRPGPQGGIRDTNRKERLRALGDAALRLFLERGLDPVTIDDITQEAGVAKGSFYRYFDDKAALLESLLRPVRDEVLGALATCARALGKARDAEAMFDAYRALGAVLAGAVLTHAGVVRLYLQENRGAPTGTRQQLATLSDEISRSAILVARKGHTHGLLRKVHPAVSALTVVGAVERLLLAVLRGEEVGNPLEIPQALTSIILEGLRVPATSAR